MHCHSSAFLRQKVKEMREHYNFMVVGVDQIPKLSAAKFQNMWTRGHT